MRLLPVAGAALLLLAGCAGSALDPDSVATVPSEQGERADILVGSIDLGEDGECLTVSTPDGDVTPVFPAPLVDWDGETLTFDGEEYGEDAVVWLDGERMRTRGEDVVLAVGLHVPEACPSEDLFLVAR